MKAMKSMLLCLSLFCLAALLGAQTAPEWQWAVGAGGTSSNVGMSIALDSQGNQYVTGTFSDTVTFGNHTLMASAAGEIFIAKLDPSGNWLWAVKAGGLGLNCGCSIATDGLGNAWVTGYFSGTATFGDHTLTASGNNEDIFVAKLDTYGNWLWAAQAGGTEYDCGNGIAVDGDGNAWATGCFGGTATFGSHTLTSSGSSIFVAKLDPSGNWLWVVQAEGPYAGSGKGIAMDEAGNGYVTGRFRGTATFGSHTLTSSGGYDIFVAKLDSSGNWLWAVKSGGASDDSVEGIAVDGSGIACIIGKFAESATFGNHTLTSNGYSGFIAEIDPSGNWLWVVISRGYDIAVDDNRNAYVTGVFWGTATFGSHTLTSSGGSDIFVAKLTKPGLVACLNTETSFGIEPLSVQFADQSISREYPIISWLWSFGEGSTSTQQNPLHTYTAPGVYTVSLTVIDQNNQSSTLIVHDYITVLERIETIEMITAEDFNFGIVYLEEQSPWQQITLANTGTAELNLGDPTFFQQPTQFEWQWQQRDMILSPGAEATLLLRFAPQVPGTVADTLYIANNSTNLPLVKVKLFAIGEHVPPSIPENVVVSMNGNNAVITWDAVTQNTHGQPITPDGYLVYYNGSSDSENGPYYFLAVTTDLAHIHVRVGEFAANMFYRVKAFKYYGRGKFDLTSLGLKEGMTEAEVTRSLEMSRR